MFYDSMGRHTVMLLHWHFVVLLHGLSVFKFTDILASYFINILLQFFMVILPYEHTNIFMNLLSYVPALGQTYCQASPWTYCHII